MTKARSLSDFIESDGSVTLVDNQKIKVGTGNDLEIYHDASDSYIKDAGTGILKLQGSEIRIQSTSGENMAIFSPDGSVQLQYDNSTKLSTISSGVNIAGQLYNSSDFTIYSGGDITLDADGGDILFKDGGSLIGFVSMASSNLNLTNNASDGDIIFTGSDSGSSVTALTLDMSEAGAATFNSDVTVGGTLNASSTQIITSSTPVIKFIESDQSNKQYQIGSFGSAFAIYDASNSQFRYTLLTDGSHIFNEGGEDCDFRIESNNNTHMLFVDGGNDSLTIGNTVVNPASGFSNQAGFGYSSTGQVQIANTANAATLVLGQNQGTNGSILDFRKQGTVVGSIAVTGADTTYNTTSDIRLKTDIEPIEDSTEKLMSMKPVKHKWKADQDADSVHGFIAQEMMEVVPEAVNGNPEGEEMMSMDYGRITPIIVGALQDAHNKIKELENKIKEMESK